MSSSRTSASEVKIAKKAASKIIAKRAVRSILGLMVFAAIVYCLIASTMTRYVPTNFGWMKIVSTNFTGGQAPAGAIVLASPGGEFTGNPFTNLGSAFTPRSETLIAEIKEGPYGAPDWKSYGFDREADETLDGQYVVECLEGCEAIGEYAVIDERWIMGIPVN